MVVVLAALMILVSDQLTNLVKDTFQRLRPSNEPGLMVHLVNAYKGGEYGFYSSHASNTFSIAVFLDRSYGEKIQMDLDHCITLGLANVLYPDLSGSSFPGRYRWQEL